jgi:hypothetical protein
LSKRLESQNLKLFKTILISFFIFKGSVFN